MLHDHVIYSVRYYPRFHVTTVALGTYYPWIRGHYSTSNAVDATDDDMFCNGSAEDGDVRSECEEAAAVDR
jgi:hypothetical protein